MLRSGLILTGGRVAFSLLRFIRNLLIARLIGVEEFGIASTFLVTFSFLEMVTDLALAQLIVQHKDGNDPKVVAAIKGLDILRGICLGGVIFIFAGEIAVLFGNPDLVWAYQLIALQPILVALSHPDQARLQREMRFEKQVYSQLTGALVTFLAIWPLSFWLDDFRLMIWVLLGEAAVMSAMTHLKAERPFRLGWNRAVFRQAMAFGLPLVAAGPLGFIALQGDRVLVANQYSATDLGLFSAALTLSMTPSLLLMSINRSFFLPILARERANAAARATLTRRTLEAHLVLGGLQAFFFGLFAPWVLVLAFGTPFAGGGGFAVLLGIIFAARLARNGPTTVSIALGHTKHTLYADMTRTVSYPLAIAMALRGVEIEYLLLLSLGAELIALSVALLAVHRCGEVALSGLILPLAAFAGVFAALVASHSLGLGSAAHLAACGALAVLLYACRGTLQMAARKARGR